MKIGLTYDLRDDYMALGFSREAVAEFDCVETVAAIDGVLKGLGCNTCRIGNVRELMRRLVDGERFDLVFNIAEGLTGFGREAQVPAILEAYGIPYTFSDPMVLSLTLHKGMTKHVVKSMGFPTPDFAVINQPSDIDTVQIPFPLFVKPVAEGTSRGISDESRVVDTAGLQRVCTKLLETYHQPVLVESFLPGREFTVGVLGTGESARAIGVMEMHFTSEAEATGYSYLNKAEWETRVTYRTIDGPAASDMERLAVGIWRGLLCRDGGRVDFRMDAAGQPSFLEINPLAGLNPSYSDLCILARLKGMDYATLIGSIVRSAMTRRLSVSDPMRPSVPLMPGSPSDPTALEIAPAQPLPTVPQATVEPAVTQ